MVCMLQFISQAAGTHIGVAKDAEIVSVRVFNCDGIATYDAIEAAYEWIYVHAPSGPVRVCIVTVVLFSVLHWQACCHSIRVALIY